MPLTVPQNALLLSSLQDSWASLPTAQVPDPIATPAAGFTRPTPTEAPNLNA